MPADRRSAHRENDRAVDRLYVRSGFASDRERVEHPFARDEATVAPPAVRAASPRRRRKPARRSETGSG